ncbi:MAG: hypothetical protein HOW73_04760 [Polyangiaceae bacterium]|nr:hypothetical protein [Polyangiaceae bacterium]
MNPLRPDQATSYARPTVTSTGDDPRYLGGKVVNALYRVVKACQIHAETNHAVVQVVDYALATLQQYFEATQVGSCAILFTPHAVFLNRSILKTSKETYQLALELGGILQECEVTEITVSRDVPSQEIVDFGRTVSEFTQTGRKSARFAEGGWDGLKLRRVVGFGGAVNASPAVRAARTYAAALMIVRNFYDELKRGKYELRQGIKRVAQKLVTTFDSGGPEGSRQAKSGGRLLLSIAAAPSADADRSNILLSGAIVALAMANQLTTDRTLLSALASAAVLYDTGRQRLIGYEREGEPLGPRVLNEDERAQLPTSSIVALTAMGKLHPPSMARAVIVHEAQALRENTLVYQGRRSALLLSRILSVAFSFIELRLPRPGAAGLGIDDAIQVLESEAPDNVGRALVKLLTGALGIFPAGTMVELSTGEMGVVLATPALPVDFARPPVRILYDAQAQLLSEPIDVDLALPAQNGQRRFVARPIDATDQQMKQMRAYVMQLAAKRAKKKTMDRMQAVKPKATPSARPAINPSNAPVARAPEGGTPGSHIAGAYVTRGSLPPSAFMTPGSSMGAVAPRAGVAYTDPPPCTPHSGETSPPSSGSAEAARSGTMPLSDPPESPHRRAPTARPMTRRWDPRAEDGAAESADGVSSKHQGVNAPGPSQRGHEPASGGRNQTRSLSWEEYNRELEVVASATPPPRNLTPRPPGMRNAPPSSSSESLSETDALLAAYLSEEETSEVSPSTPPAERPSARFGLRWTGTGKNPLSEGSGEPAPSTGRSTGRPSAYPVDRDSSIPSSNAGLRWGGSQSGALSSQGRDSFSDTPPPSSPFTPAPFTPSPISSGPQADQARSFARPKETQSNRMPTAPVVPPAVGRMPTGPVVPPAVGRMPTGPVVPPAASPPTARAPTRTATAPWSSGARKTGADPRSEDAHVEPTIEQVEPAASTPIPEGPTSKRAKAGTSNWGSPRRGKP